MTEAEEQKTESPSTPGLLKIAEKIKAALEKQQKALDEGVALARKQSESESNNSENAEQNNGSEVVLDSLLSPELNSETYLIFTVQNHSYAINTSKLLQISVTKVFKLPFVPEYIEGVINVHGTPFTVVNTLKLAGEEKSDIPGSTFLVLNRSDDQFCIHISNIELFFEPEEEDIQEDKIRYKHRFVPIFDDDSIEDCLCRDLNKY